ncbi:unnamed protein product [Cercospora beticola]|nr:unnamed protein product [Cercospora beticola]
MLGAHFKEGHTLATGAQLDLPLPDDDAKSMLTICRIMHMCSDVPAVKRSKAVLEIAVLVDKYKCKAALSYPISVWIQDPRLYLYDSDRMNLFIAAYILELPADFTRPGQELVHRTRSSFPSADIPGGDEYLEHVIYELKEQLEDLRHDAVALLNSIIETECVGTSRKTENSPRCALQGCKYVLIRSHNFMTKLIRSELWPITSIKERSLSSVCEGLLRFSGDWTQSIPDCNKTVMGCSKDHMETTDEIFNDLKAFARTVELKAIRPCLTCVKEGYVQIKGGCVKGH